jgi:hypothetical protein
VTEQEVNERLQRFWERVVGPGARAATVLELWLERERVAEADGVALPTRQETLWEFAGMITPSEAVTYRIAEAYESPIPRLILPPARPVQPMTWNVGWVPTDEDLANAKSWGLA